MLIQKFELGSDAWITDPRRTAPKSLLQVVQVAKLLAEARNDLAITRAERCAWTATATTVLAAKYAKWPKWRVDAKVQSESQYRFHEVEVANAEEAVVVLEAVAFACQQRVKLLGDFYNVKE